jgi:hypothetical protein
MKYLKLQVALGREGCSLRRSSGGFSMNLIKVVSCLLSVVSMSGCASLPPQDGARGPELVGGGRSTETGHYAEVGVEFSTWGDFVALVAPNRWKSPIATGGSLSWLNPVAWSEDAGRTGRILLGEAVVVGGAVAAAEAAGSDGSSSAPPPGSSTSPPPPSGGGSGVPPPPEF